MGIWEMLQAYRMSRRAAGRAGSFIIHRIIGVILIIALAVGGFLFVKSKTGSDTSTLSKLKNQIETMMDSSKGKKKADGMKAGKYGNKKKLHGSYSVMRVKDGDTLVVSAKKKEITVRLVGVDTPESVASKDNTSFGKKSSNYTKKKLPSGTKVWLEYANEKKDPYGRTLAFVWYKNAKGKMVMYNRILLKKGMARAAYYKSTGNQYRSNFKKLHLQAKNKKKGFWGEKGGFKAAFPHKNEMDY